METNQPRPNNYLALAIISTFLCCLITGVISIIYASQVNTKYDAGDYSGALAASKNAKLWALIGIISGVVFLIGYFAIFGIALISGLASGGY